MDIIRKSDFPEIPDFYSQQYENLINALMEGTCIFIGAGASNLAGYKLWNALKTEIIDYYWNNRDKIYFNKNTKFDLSFCESLKEYTDPVEVFDYLYYCDSEMFLDAIKSILLEDEKKTSNKIYQILNKLNNRKNFFVTTNIDMGFQNYLNIRDNNVSIFPELTNPPKLLNYIHGRIDVENSWIFTTNQYSQAYTSASIGAPCMKFLIEIFQRYSVFFIGYGLREKEIKQAITQTSRRKQHYWLEPFKRKDEDSLMIRGTIFKETYNISLIPYYVDSKGYELLFEVIDSLYRVMSGKLRGGI